MTDNIAERLLAKYTVGNPELFRILAGHSRVVADMSLHIARLKGLEVDLDFVEEAALLHDIGVGQCDAPSINCFGKLPYICHGVAGAEILQREGLPRHALVAERHTGSGLTAEEVWKREFPLPERDYLPLSLEEKLICYADKFFSKSRDLRAPKPLEKIRSQMWAHGSGPGSRFAALEALFGDPLPTWPG